MGLSALNSILSGSADPSFFGARKLRFKTVKILIFPVKNVKQQQKKRRIILLMKGSSRKNVPLLYQGSSRKNVVLLYLCSTAAGKTSRYFTYAGPQQ